MVEVGDVKINTDVVKCSAVGCSNILGDSSRVSLFRFPCDRARCKTWLINCGRADIDAQFQLDPLFPSRNCWLCSDHFEPCQFVSKDNSRLIARALPTLFGDTGELNSCESDVQLNEDIDVCQPRRDGDVALGDTDGYGIENIEKLPVGRASSVVSLVNRLVGALAQCGDDVFGDRVAVVSQLLSVWSEGDEVELRCNEPPSVVTTQLSAADVDRLVAAAHADTTDAPVFVQFAFSKDLKDDHTADNTPTQHVSPTITKQPSTYRQPTVPRRRPGDPVVLFPCAICGRTYRYHSQLEQHQKHHAGVRPHQCPVCGRRFALQCSRDKHLTTHSADRPLMCDTCGQRFAHVNYLKSHQRSHEDRPRRFRRDGKFANATGLRQHAAAMHSAAGSEFSCHQCGCVFPTMAQVRVHVRSHVKDEQSSTNCDAAGETRDAVKGGRDNRNYSSDDAVVSDTVASLHHHLLTGHCTDSSSSQRPAMTTHCCSVCGKRFVQQSNLEAHVRTHHRRAELESSYSCVRCGSEFGELSALHQHELQNCTEYVMDAVDSGLDMVVVDSVSSVEVDDAMVDGVSVNSVLTDPVNCNVDDIALCGFV